MNINTIIASNESRQTINLILTIVLLIPIPLWIVSFRKGIQWPSKNKHWMQLFLTAYKLPFSVAVFICSLLVLSYMVLPYFNLNSQVYHIQGALIYSINIFLLLIAYWFIFRLINQFYYFLINQSISSNFQYFLPLLRALFIVILFFLLMNSFLAYFEINDYTLSLINKMSSVVIIAFIAWFSIRSMRIYEEYFMQKTQDSRSELHKSAVTKIQVLKKMMTIMVIILSLIAILMVFDKARSIGISLLASAGIIGAIVTFLAQKPLSALTSGMQMAISHPVEIGDKVVIQNELGTVEKVTLSHVVVQLWDLRTLFVPTRYFLEEPFQNWTYRSSALLGTVFLYVDYFVSVDRIRAEFDRLLQHTPLWDGQTKTLQVTDAKENYLELRCLVSAANSGELWDLRCYLRENLIKFLRENHAEHFPKIRISTDRLEKNL